MTVPRTEHSPIPVCDNCQPANDGGPAARQAIVIVRSATDDPSQVTRQLDEGAITLLTLGVTRFEVVDGSGLADWGARHPVLRALLARARNGSLGYVVLRDVARAGRLDGAYPALVALHEAGRIDLVVGGRLRSRPRPLSFLMGR